MKLTDPILAMLGTLMAFRAYNAIRRGTFSLYWGTFNFNHKKHRVRYFLLTGTALFIATLCFGMIFLTNLK